jgi:glycosyltransferase involved in cell wall biosynthesis
VVSLLTDGLVDRGHEVTLFATGDSRTTAKLVSAFEEAPGSPFINSQWHDTVHTLLAFRDPSAFDVYHVHTPWSALAAGVLAGPPVIHTLHGTLTPELRRLYGELADHAWFVAISEAQQRLMPELRHAGVVHNGIDLDRYPFRSEKDDYLLFLGRASPDKGLLRAVETARAASARLVIALKIAGEDEQEHWENDVKQILSDDIELHGEISHEHKVDLLSRARAVLFPIDWDEPFGLVMTEAMACGTPVIATPRGAVPEVLVDGETGFIVPVETYVEAAVARIDELDAIDPKACRRRVEERFTKEVMIEGYERVFEKVVSEEG